MELAFYIYLTEVVCSLGKSMGGFFVIGLCLCVVAYVVLGICLAVGNEGEKEAATRINTWLKPKAIWIMVFAFMSALIPDKEVGRALLIAYGAQSFIEMEQTQQLGSKAYKALDKLLSDYVEETTEEKKQ